MPDKSVDFSEIQLPQDVVLNWDMNYEHNYNKGDRVKVGSHIYESLIENNTWSPIDFPGAWELIV